MLGGVAGERELKPVYLLTGSDRPKIAVALQRLRGRIGEDATEQLHAGEASGEDAIAACNSLGLFGGEARLVVVDGVELLGRLLTDPPAQPLERHRDLRPVGPRQEVDRLQLAFARHAAKHRRRRRPLPGRVRQLREAR